MILIASVGLSMSLLAACGGSTSSSKANSSGSAASDATLTVGDPQPPSSLDPAAGTSGGDYVYLYMIYARLLNFNQTTGAIEPGLASGYGFTGANNLTFDLTLRQGVTFQDGEPFNAQAVADSLQHYQQLKVQTDLSSVKSVDVTGKYTLALHLSSPDSALPASLADRAGMIVCPSALTKYGSGFGDHPCGAGPYEVTSYVSGASITLKRFAKYYGVSPGYATIDWTMYSTSTALVTAARSGQLDVALQVPATDVTELKGNPDFTVEVGPSLLYTQVYFDDAESPLNSRDVRLAFNDALNRQAILDAVDDGQGSIAWQPYPQGSQYYDSALGATYPYSPQKAKSLLAAAGYPNGVSFRCVDFPGLGFSTAGPLIEQQEAAVGIHITITEESLTEALAQSAKGIFPCSFSAWTGRPAPALAFDDLYLSTGIYNLGHVNFGLDGDIAQLNSSYTTTSQVAAVHKIVAASIPEAPDAPLVFAPAVTLVAPSVAGFVNNFQGKEDLAIVTPSGK